MPSNQIPLRAMPAADLANPMSDICASTANPNAPTMAISFKAVNGWRGPAAIVIAVAHLAVVTDFISHRFLRPITLVVDLFFVLSGLLITQAYSEKLRRASAIPEYVLRRLGRIWPVQAVTLGVLVAYELMKLVLQTTMGKQFSSPAFSPDGLNFLGSVPTNLFLVQSLGLHDRETWNFPSWSLSVEFFTYLVFAFVCLATPILRRTLAVGIVIASIAILIFIAPHQMRSTFDFGIFRCLAGFFAGSLCYEIIRSVNPPRLPYPTLLELAAIAMICLWLGFAPGTYWAFAAPFVICLFAVSFLPARGLVSRVLETRPFQVLAELSFAIYMVHTIVLLFVLALLHEIERAIGQPLFSMTINPTAAPSHGAPTVQILHLTDAYLMWAIGVFYLAAVFLLSIVIHRFVENPGRSIFNRLAKTIVAQPSGSRTASRLVGSSLEPAP